MMHLPALFFLFFTLRLRRCCHDSFPFNTSPSFSFRSFALLGQILLSTQVHKVEKQATNAGDKPKTWITYELSDYNWMSYRRAKTYADRVGLGIKNLGVNKGDFVMIFASTW